MFLCQACLICNRSFKGDLKVFEVLKRTVSVL